MVRLRHTAPAVLAGVLVAAVFLVSANADVSFVTTWGTSGLGAGELNSPNSVAVGPSGDVYVADEGNNRVSEFTAAGVFVRAWGWGVTNGASSFEICTSSCQQGLDGGGGGEFSDPVGVATDTLGDVYVVDTSNERVDEFSSSGAFIQAFGKDVDQTTSGDVCTAASGDTCQAGSSGSGAGHLSAPAGVAVDTSGNVYVADLGNFRIDVFSSSTGAFTEAFGKDVDQTTSGDVCTAASGDTCQIGTSAGGAGQINGPEGVASAGGNVYVADPGNERIDEFSSSGVFVRAWGRGVGDGGSSFEMCTSSCHTGTTGSGSGQMNSPSGVATDAAGNVYVADSFNERVDEFSASGTFVKAWGWGVKDGASSFESCTNSCHQGVAGDGAGQFTPFNGVGAAGDSSGAVYVADRGNDRVETFSNTYGLSVSKSGKGSGTVTSLLPGIHCGATCAHAFGEGTVVTLTASPNIGSAFAGWAGACAGTSNCIVTMNQAWMVKATFTSGAAILPVALTASGLRALAKSLHQAIYWGGPEPRHMYELTRTPTGFRYVRYLPAGVKAGSAKRYLTVATYPFRGAFKALEKFAKGKEFRLRGGGIGYGRTRSDFLLAWPRINFEVEVYSPSAAEARKIAKSGRVAPVR